MNVIDEIKSRLDIVEVMSTSGIELRRTGRSYIGFCPFHHNVNTPAFTVYPDTQSFYCFGCQAHGSVFDFVMRQQGLEFREALQQLAQQAGIELRPRTPEETEQDQQRTRLLEIASITARYFNYLLVQHPRGQPGRDYLEQRSINQQTLEAFQLGYSLNERTHLLRYLTEKKGYDPADALAAGVISHHDEHGYYDRFRGRLIFPIRTVKGEVIGFGGRALGDRPPKYLNTPQTPLFDKSQVLYGIDQARDHIRQSDSCLVVEGYVDVLTAHQHGFRNVVAPLGTAMTSGHVGLLKKLSHNVYLALDADAAGQRATLKGLDALQHAPPEAGENIHSTVTAQGMVTWSTDLNLRIIQLPDGRDPDDVIKSDPQHWQQLIDHALPVIDFYILAYTADLHLEQAQDQRTALDRLVPLLAKLDPTQQRVYVTRLEQVVGMRSEFILDLLKEKRTATTARPQRRPRPRDNEPPPARSQAAASGASRSQTSSHEDYLLALLLRHPRMAGQVESWLRTCTADFPQVQHLLGQDIDRLLEHTANRLLWERWQQSTPGGMGPQVPLTADMLEAADPPAWMQQLEPALSEHLRHLLTLPMPAHRDDLTQREVERCARQLRIAQVGRWEERLRYQASEQEADSPAYQQTMALGDELRSYWNLIKTPGRTPGIEDLRDSLQR